MEGDIKLMMGKLGEMEKQLQSKGCVRSYAGQINNIEEDQEMSNACQITMKMKFMTMIL